MSGSTVKALMPALTALWAGAGVKGLEVSDGPVYDPEEKHLIVGWSGGESAPITVSRQVADAAMRMDRETYDVACLLSFWIGNAKTVAAVRDALLDAFDIIDAALNATPTLGGLTGVARARITEYAIDPDIYETGDRVAMPFTVHVDAWA